MPAEAPPPPELLEAVRRSAGTRAVTLIADSADAAGFADTRAARDTLEATARIPCALVVSTWVGAGALDVLVARLRDVLADELYVLHPEEPELAARMRALGLETAERAAGGGRDWRLQRYRVQEYKRTPRWLSPRHWAHPERWDRFRW